MKTLFTAPLLFLCCLFISFINVKAQNFEGTLSIQSEYQSAEKSKAPKKSSFVLFLKNDKALLEDAGIGKIILHAKEKEIFAIVGKGNQPTVWKVNLNTLNELGGLLAVMKSVTGQDLMNIRPDTKLTTSSSTQTLSGYKTKKYQSEDATYSGSVWISENFPFDLSQVWDLFNVKKPLEQVGTKNAMILKAVSKNKKTEETTSLLITPKKGTVGAEMFAIPAGAQILDITPMLVQMLQSQKPEEVQKMLLQMIPKNK